MTTLVEQVSKSGSVRWCLTCRRNSDRTKFVGRKWGLCVAEYGLPVGWKPAKKVAKK